MSIKAAVEAVRDGMTITEAASLFQIRFKTIAEACKAGGVVCRGRGGKAGVPKKNHCLVAGERGEMGQAVFDARMARGMSVEDLSERSGVSISSLRQLECGHRSGQSADFLQKLLDAFKEFDLEKKYDDAE